jgi:hypothetical protein
MFDWVGWVLQRLLSFGKDLFLFDLIVFIYDWIDNFIMFLEHGQLSSTKFKPVI